jgi:hypothetical protein
MLISVLKRLVKNQAQKKINEAFFLESPETSYVVIIPQLKLTISCGETGFTHAVTLLT